MSRTDAESILVGEEKELRVLYGEGYRFYGLNARDLTTMTDSQLEDVAEEQRSCLYMCHPLDKGKQREEVERCLRAER